MLSVEKSTGNLVQLRIDERGKADLAEPYVTKGCEAEKNGKDKDAIRAYDTALFYWPRCMMALMNKGAIYLRREKYRGAEICFTRALEIEPEFFLLHYNLAKTLEALGRLQEAVEHYRAVIKWRVNEYSGDYLDLALVYEKMGEWKNAMEQCMLANACLSPTDEELGDDIQSLAQRLFTKTSPSVPPEGIVLFFNKNNRLIFVQE